MVRALSTPGDPPKVLPDRLEGTMKAWRIARVSIGALALALSVTARADQVRLRQRADPYHLADAADAVAEIFGPQREGLLPVAHRGMGQGASRRHARRHVQQHRHQRQHDADAGAGHLRPDARLRDARLVLPQPLLSVPAAARSLLWLRSGERLRRLCPQRHARTGRETEGAVGQYRCARAVLPQGPRRESAENMGRADRAGGGAVEAWADRLPVSRRARRRRGDGAPADVLGAGRRTRRCFRQAGVRRRQESRRHAEPARISQTHHRLRRQPRPRRELQVRGRSVPGDPARQRRDVPRRQLDGQATARPRRQERLGRRADPADDAGRSRHRRRRLDLCRVHARCEEAGHHHRPDQQPGCRPGRDGGVHRGDRQPSDPDERRAGRLRLCQGSDGA